MLFIDRAIIINSYYKLNTQGKILFYFYEYQSYELYEKIIYKINKLCQSIKLDNSFGTAYAI